MKYLTATLTACALALSGCMTTAVQYRYNTESPTADCVEQCADRECIAACRGVVRTEARDCADPGWETGELDGCVEVEKRRVRAGPIVIGTVVVLAALVGGVLYILAGFAELDPYPNP